MRILRESGKYADGSGNAVVNVFKTVRVETGASRGFISRARVWHFLGVYRNWRSLQRGTKP